MTRAFFLLPLCGFALVAAAPVTPPTKLPLAAPAMVAEDMRNLLRLDLSNGGQVVILLRPDAAPRHVARVQALAQRGFYDGLLFHRVIPGFMAQTGDPKGTGAGGSELPDLAAEFNRLPHLRGTVAAARTEAPDSFNSQFFIMFAPRFALDHKYTVFGRVVGGMAAVDSIAAGEPPAAPTRIVKASLGAFAAPPAAAVAAAPIGPAASASPPAVSVAARPLAVPVVAPPPAAPPATAVPLVAPTPAAPVVASVPPPGG